MEQNVIIVICFGILLQHADSSPLYPYSDIPPVSLDGAPPQPINFPFPVHYSGFVFQTASVENFGAITFGIGDGQVRDSLDSHFDVKWHLSHRDVFFLAPFYMNTEQPDDVSKVYIQRIDTASNRTFLEQMDEYVDAMFISHSDICGRTDGKFESKFILIVTWEQLTSVKEFVTAGDCHDGGQCKRNTFQTMLIANENQTYSIFNYEQLQAFEDYDQVGFYGGKSNGWTDVRVPTSDLVTYQGSDVIGRMVYKIDGDVIQHGGCQGTRPSATGKWLLTYPKNGGAYGGTVVVVQGFCLDPDDVIQCHFGGASQAGEYVSQTKARCYVPKLLVAGIVDLKVKITRDGATYEATTKFTINVQSLIGYDTSLFNGNDMSPEYVRVEWDPSRFSNDMDALLDFNLYGYREGETVDWRLIRTIQTGVRNGEGRFEFSPAPIRCHGATCTDYDMGTIELVVQNKSMASYQYSAHKILALGWFTKDYMKQNSGPNWVEQKCDAWYQKEIKDLAWLDTLLNCPCTLDQALLDYGRFLTDPGCSIFAGSKCTYHKGAVHCVRSVVPKTAAGNQCCYGADGLLRFSEDSYQGSTPDKSHTWGARPFGRPDHVPNLSHWLVDVVTFYHCCLWVDYRDCDKYMEVRATRDCSGYIPPKTAVAFGDPHIRTFDGTTYNFGGKGDFVLLRAKSFEMQGKFTQLKSQYGDRPSTAITGVAINDPTDSVNVIEFYIRPEEADRTSRTVDVLIDGQFVYFDVYGMAWQDFNGFYISYADERKMHSNFTVVMDSGIGIRIVEANGMLQVKCNIPHEYMDNTAGLLGTYDDKKENDFKSASHHVIPVGSNATTVYTSFGLSWKVESKDASLFRNFEAADESFIPVFSPDTSTSNNIVTADNVSNVCGDDPQCAFDYYVTGVKEIAMSSRRVGDWYTNAEHKLHASKSCGILSVPHSTKDNYNYSVGNTVTVSGCRGDYALQGQHLTYTCQSTAGGGVSWNPDVDAVCAAESVEVDAGEIGMIVGISVGSAAAVIMALAMLCVVLRKRRQSRNGLEAEERANSEPIVRYRTKDQEPTVKSTLTGERKSSDSV